MRRALLVLVLAALGCKSKRDLKTDDPMPLPAVVDASAATTAATKPWPELEGYPRVTAERVISLPSRPDAPRFDLGGPVIAGDIAIVSSSAAGFVAVNWKTGAIAWTKPAGMHVAPPLIVEAGIVLIGDCVNPPAVPDTEQLVGCLRVVTPAGTDRAYLAIRAKPAAVAGFLAEKGEQAVWKDRERVRWKRGAAAISIDLVSGVAKPADPAPPPLAVTYKDKHWDVVQVDGRIVAYRGGTKQIAWETEHPYSALIGAVYLPEMSPMLRLANLGAYRESPEVHLIDIDATGSLRAQVARSSPGIGLLAQAISSVGDVVLVLRLDTSRRRDLVVGYSANALLMWVYPLPEQPRQDRVGVAISDEADAVVVFHDGDTITVLPDLTAPPATPGAAHASKPPP